MTIQDLREKKRDLERKGVKVDALRVEFHENTQTIKAAELFVGTSQVFSYPQGFKSNALEPQKEEKEIHIRGAWKHLRNAQESANWTLKPVDQEIFI